ncbi:hypothetical protein [Muribaculum sp. NM65_B17]|jgi:hypothetical protein|nr:hypothetical protein [Muribaculum sp. NM65_B17]TGY02698.1 hypothetical protein E5354_12180 [Muribaculum sp. NM65_B17]THG43500.1 hypothetical protein E5985_04415 [Muribaculaceae bacterium]
MRKIKFLLISFMALFIAFGMTSCSSEDEPDQPDDPTVIQDYHFDLWVALDRHGGMGRDVQTLVRSVNSLEAGQPEITFQGTGTEVNSILSLETILKGAYYYQVPVSGDRFAKYIIKDNKVEVVKERRFQTNTYATRKYTHAWINDNTLVIMAATGDATKIVWTKLNADDMTIISEGTLDVPMPEGGELFTTSGILNYRASDNKLFYFYFAKQSGRRGKRVTPMMTAVINPATMAVESNTPCFLDCEMVGTAYGELLQTTTFIDGNNNLYIACVTDDADGKEYSHLLKIPANSTSFDQSYDGFTAGGKLISVMYVGDNKVVAYARDDAAGTDIDSFSHYYTVIDVVSKTSTPITYNGQRLAYSSGRFSSRMAYVNHKAYVGVDTEGQKPQIYIYDVEKNQTALGATMASGYYFEQIRVVEDAK